MEKLVEESKKNGPLTLDQFQNQCPKLYSRVFSEGEAAGRKKQRDRFNELRRTLNGDNKLICRCFEKGSYATEALQMALEKAIDEKAAIAQKLNELQIQREKTPQQPRQTPAQLEFSQSIPAGHIANTPNMEN